MCNVVQGKCAVLKDNTIFPKGTERRTGNPLPRILLTEELPYVVDVTRDRWKLTFKRRIKSHLPFAGNIRSSPYSTGFQDRGNLRLFSKSQKNVMKYKQYRQPTRCNNNGLLIIPVSSTCFGQLFCPSSAALDRVLQLVV